MTAITAIPTAIGNLAAKVAALLGFSASPPNGSLLIGNGTGYSNGTITPGTGITVTNAAGGITIASSGSSGQGIIPAAGSIASPYVRPAGSAFTWRNQHTGFYTDHAGGPLSLQYTYPTSTKLIGLEVTPPATPYTYTALLTTQVITNVQYPAAGIYLTDGTKFVVLGIQSPSNYLVVLRYTDVNTGNGNVFNGTIARQDVWLRITNDGTNLNFYFSFDGYDYSLVYTELKGAYLGTITAAGFLTDTSNNSGTAYPFPMVTKLWSWVQT